MLGDYPALFLPRGSTTDRRRRGGGSGAVNTPGAGRQAARLGPVFRRLAAAIERERISLGDDPGVAEQEAVLVLEVATSVPDFYRAVARVDGLEFLLGVGDVEQEQDDDFWLEDTAKPIRGALYMVFTDLQARRELLALWERWEADGRLDRPYGRFSEVFHHLRTIRRWGPADRIQETGLVERWQADLQLYGRSSRRAQIELWFHPDASARRRAEHGVAQSIDTLGGRVVNSYELEAIRYHGMLIEVPASSVDEVLRAPATAQLLTIGEFMFARPLPQGFPNGEAGDDELPEEKPPEPSQVEPVVALLDGVPIANHPLLSRHLSLVDTDGYEPRTPAARRHHGTAMASLIVHGDLSDPRPLPSRPIAVRPVMEGTAFGDREHFPDDRLPLDVVHQAVIDLVHGDDAATPSVRIINVSLGDPAAIFHGPLSPWARLLDYLADRYSLLFIVSAGNHDGPIALSPSEDGQDLEGQVLAHLRGQTRSRGLLAPAEAINALTVGAAPVDASIPDEDDPRLDLIASPDLPAVYSALGRGFRRAVKPDILAEGGRLRYRAQVGADRAFEAALATRPPGVRVAAPGAQPLSRGGLKYDAGTSHAAARTTGEAGRLWDQLDELGDPPDWLDDRVRPLLIRALLVHAAEWGEGPAVLRDKLPNLSDGELAKLSSLMLGYGRVRWDRLQRTEPSRVTLLAGGTLGDGAGAVHRIPLPNALNAIAGRRRITTTLTWCSPINLQDQRYRTARLWTHLDRGPLILTGEGPDHHEVQRGTVEHRMYAGDDRVAVSDSEIAVHVSCAADAGKLERFVPYALAVSIETAPELGLPVHQQVAAMVRQQAGVRPQPRIRP
jgi:hypothetical protein